MFVPSVEATQITIQLLGKYKDEGNFEDAIKLEYDFITPEDFLREHFAQHSYSVELQDEVTELFFRISKFRKYLTMIEKEYLKNEKSSLLKESSDSSVNLVFLYLLIIELNEFSKPKIEQLLMSINEKKMMLLLTILKKADTITKLFGLGIQIWDVEYVKKILQNILEKPLFKEVCETVAIREKEIKKNRKKELTVPVGPKCSECPRKSTSERTISSPPLMTRIPILIRATPVPSTTYARPNQLEKIEEACRKNRKEAAKKYEEAQKNAFRCANIDKLEKVKKVSDDVEMEKPKIVEKKISWSKIKSKEVQYPKKTAAVILREGARLLKLEQEEIKRYEDLASGGFNSDLIAEWEKEIREETYQKKIADIEKKHLEGLLSYEEALIAKQKCLQKKKDSAAEFKKEKENWLNQLEMWRKEEQKRIQESFEKGKAYEKGAKEAVEHVKEEKHKIVLTMASPPSIHYDLRLICEPSISPKAKSTFSITPSHVTISKQALETMEESRALKERWLKEKQQDLQRKIQLMKEIKALQALGVVKRKQTDFTETANLGLLYEMSLAELKERLYILKIEVQEELERRRAEVKMRRECRQEIINSYQELIESHQKTAQEQKKRSECELNAKESKARPLRSSTSLEGLRQKLYEKRIERLKHQVMC